ncbi:MAG: DUF3800 domain-containing protein [Pseudomonadota bacterium]|nr:DUF3800 domain-containing protein [Pseudomonadota bacterium]
MAQSFMFADEAGCFTFKRQNGASNYFILCTVCMDDCSIANALMDIRRRLIVRGEPNRNKLHATTDSHQVRDEVYDIITQSPITIDATILEKSKAYPRTRIDDATFYKYAWHYHFKHIGPMRCAPDRRTLITAAALGTNRTRASFKVALNNVIQQALPRDRWEVSFMESSQDPGLWVADYCAWAIQRKWERDDRARYDQIKEKIATEYNLWRSGNVHHY